MKSIQKLSIMFSLLFLLSGCSNATDVKTAQTPDAVQSDQPVSENSSGAAEDLGDSVQKMKAFMASDVTATTISGKPPVADSSFTAETLLVGTFQNINYMSSGNVSLQKKDNTYYVVFDKNFMTPNGPDIQVYLTKNSASTQRSDIKNGLALGKLKSLTGKQVYTLPSDVNIADFHSVSLHCKAFNVPWSYAPLQ